VIVLIIISNKKQKAKQSQTVYILMKFRSQEILRRCMHLTFSSLATLKLFAFLCEKAWTVVVEQHVIQSASASALTTWIISQRLIFP